MKSPITTHVLDTSLGAPAHGVDVVLHRIDGDATREIARGTTNDDGRAGHLLPPGSLDRGTYRLSFDTGAYFAKQGRSCFYPRVDVVFLVADDGEHFHVPLLLSPIGYTTYRGS